MNTKVKSQDSSIKTLKVHLGILADPAKIDLYSEEFYQIFEIEDDNFALLGASERFVTKRRYKKMYKKILHHIKKRDNPPYIPGLTPEKYKNSFDSAIGLFPSSTQHLIRGPKFIFAPIPINSTSNYLLFKAKFLTKLLSPFLKAEIYPLAYHPMGGKAAKRTKADTNPDPETIKQRFIDARNDPFFKWFYIEAGSGQQRMNKNLIQDILEAQAMNGNSYPTIVPNAIYGGGIKSVEDVKTILSNKYIPQAIVVGNISEEDPKITYKILEYVKKFNLGLD